MSTIPTYLSLIADCLAALSEALDLDLADIHEVEFLGMADIFRDSCMAHVNHERFAYINLSNGKPDVRFSAYYSDFDYLFLPSEETAA